MLLDGIHIPLTTPFYPDGRLNLRKLEHNVDRFSRTPAAGLLLLGPQGEATTLSDAESREAIAIAIAAATPEKVMLAAIRRDGLPITLDLLDDAATAGYDAALIFPPSTATHPREALTYLQALADRSPVPLILTGPLTLDTIAELAPHPRIVAFLECTGDATTIKALKAQTATIRRTATVTTIFAAVTARMLKQSATPQGASTFVNLETLQGGGTALATAPPAVVSTLKTRTRETGFQILTASTTGILQALRAGATGAIPTLAACAPQACYEVLAGFKDGDQSLAEEKQHRLLAAAARIEQLGIPALKYAADLNGYFGGHPRLPLLPLSAAQKSEIEALMQPMRN